MASMETLVRNFDDNVLGSWTAQGAGVLANQVFVRNGQVEIVTTGVSGDYNWLQSPTTYDLTGSYATVRVVSLGSQAANFDCLPMNLIIDSANDIHWDINGNTIGAVKKIAGTQTFLKTAPYVASTYRWLRIRESAGTTYFDYSSDGEAFIKFISVANPITVTALSVLIEAGQFGAVASDTMQIDNFNFRNSGYQRIGVGSGMSRSEVAN